MLTGIDEQSVRARYRHLESELDERGRRIWAATEAAMIGHGGVRMVARATGLAESTVRLGKHELGERGHSQKPVGERRVRRSGGGRKALVQMDSKLAAKLEDLVEPPTRGHPATCLRWTLKSTRRLAEELTAQGHPISHTAVGKLLDELGYSLQGTRKTLEGGNHPDRNAQFEYIAQRVSEYQGRGQPVISVDTKKKELVGDFTNSGKEFRPKGNPIPVRVHDFIDKELGKAIPYGVYDLSANAGWVSVVMNHETAEFAVSTIHTWWKRMGQKRYIGARELLITADGGGSNASRNRLWKQSLQTLSEQTGLSISVCHFPPGTSKWNKIEHRMFCWITENWRGRPLTSHAIIVNLIANTSTSAGLKIEAEVDRRTYEKGIRITDDAMADLNIKPAEFHGDWNYTILFLLGLETDELFISSA